MVIMNPIVKKVLSDLEKVSFWDWDQGFFESSNGHRFSDNTRKSPDGTYELYYNGSISNIPLSQSDKDIIRHKIQEQREIKSKNHRIEISKKQLDKMGINFEEVKQFLDI